MDFSFAHMELLAQRSLLLFNLSIVQTYAGDNKN